MRNIILSVLFVSINLFAEVVNVVPYLGVISYSDKELESIKSDSLFGGVYANTGTLAYLLEFNYSYMDTSYKQDQNLSNLEQHDMTLIYAKYNDKFMFKVGAHYTATNDEILGDGIIAILGLERYHFIGYDKLTYGIEGYYSYYKNRIDENILADSNTTASPSLAGGRPGGGGDSSVNDLISKMGIIQLSPYISYFKSLGYYKSNTISFKMNYQYTDSYNPNQYLSYEIRDKFVYNYFVLDINVYFGEMKSGVVDGGMSIFNSLDLRQNGLGLSLGYYFTKDLSLNLSYALNIYEEAFLNEQTTNSVSAASLGYRF